MSELDSMLFYEPGDDRDSILYMMLRRQLNQECSLEDVDFNAEGLLAGQNVLGRELTDFDEVVDVGSSDGSLIAKAAIATGVQARITGIEPLKEAHSSHERLDPELRNRVKLIRGRGEHLPYSDSSVSGVSLHNVVFRPRSGVALLREAQRVTKPGGFVVVSTNSEHHAPRRHGHEREIARLVMQQFDIDFTVPEPPAQGFYLENFRRKLRYVPGLEEIPGLYVEQDTLCVITPGERLADYLAVLKYSAANSDIDTAGPEHRWHWRHVVDEVIKPEIEAEMAASADSPKDELYQRFGQYIADPIRRGMYVMRVSD